jgi:two-component system nitrate/nitrite response regulator NarL
MTESTNPRPTRIVLVDDHPLMRKGMVQLLALEPDFEVVGEAASGAAALPLCREVAPDLVLLDLNMAGMNGIETLRQLRDAGCRALAVVYTVSDNAEDVARALRAGANGYLLKDMEPEALIDALREILEGNLTVSPQLTSAMARVLRGQETPPVDISALTDREQQILRLIAEGHSNKVIGRKLDIAETTVKVHVKHLLKKLNMRSRVEAAIWAVRRNRDN